MLSMLSKRQCCFPLFKQFLETEMTWSQPIEVSKRMHFQESELMFRVMLKGKSGINQI